MEKIIISDQVIHWAIFIVFTVGIFCYLLTIGNPDTNHFERIVKWIQRK